MKRFSLIGRLGLEGETNIVPIQGDSEVFEIDFLDGYRRVRFGIGEALEELLAIGLQPPEAAVDLVIVAALVNAGDTHVRRATNAQDGWTREIDLYVPVSNPDIWAGVANHLEHLLKFLTGDRWRLIFRLRPKRMSSIVKPTNRLPIDSLEEVSLFSGGLDSLIGAIDLLASGRQPLFVSHYWDTVTAAVQTYLVERLQQCFPNVKVKSLRIRLGFDKHALDTGKTEDTQRGRSFLFYALASLVAASFGRLTQVNIPENGLIALNVPLDPLRLGALSTRTAHPHFIAGMEELVQQVGLQVRLVNPYRHCTKGEMVAACKDAAFLEKEVGNSMSCSSPAKFRYKNLSWQHCGYCVPCLIRRASLRKGLAIADPTLYKIADISAQTLRTDKAEGVDVRSFQLLARRLKRNQDLANVLVHIPGPLIHAPDDVSGYVDVFRRGVVEVSELLEGVTAKPSR